MSEECMNKRNFSAFIPEESCVKYFFLFLRCGTQKQCVVNVNSKLFHDACPGTHKYLEIHYACLSSNNNAKGALGGGGRKMPVLPAWMRPKATTTTVAPVDKNSVNTVVGNGNENK